MAKFYAKEDELKEVLKSGETPDKLIYKESVEGETRAVNESSLTIDFTISSSNIDRMHDSIDQNGWDLKAFKKNPVVLWAHDQSQPPIAKALSRSIKVDGKKLLATAQFMPADVSEFSYMIFQMYKLGFMNATSVGFRPLEWSFAEDDKRPYGVNFTKQELLEFSCVPVPANADALMGAKSMGVNTRPLKTWVENALDGWKDEGDLLVPRSSLEELHKSLSNRVKLLKPLEEIMSKEKTVEETEVKEVVAETIVENKEVITETKKEGSDVAVSSAHNPELVAAFNQFSAVHKAAQNLHRSAAALHKSAMGGFCKAFDPNGAQDGDGTDYDPNDKALNELVEKYLEAMNTKTVTEVVVKAEVDTTKIEGIVELVELVKSLQTQVADLTALVNTKAAVAEVKTDVVTETVVEKDSDEFTFSFEDSVDKENESVSFEEVKQLLSSLNFDEMIEKKLKAKLGSKV
jgi:HK97 family phage prohead protease